MKRYLFLILAAIFCLPNTALAQYRSSNSRLFSSSTTWEREMRDQNRRNNKFFGESKAYQSAKKKKPRINRVYLLAIENTTDEATGITTCRWNDGSSYIGITNSGAMLVGTMTYADGSKYVGPWVRNMPNGNGTFQTPEGITFTTTFVNGVPHGKGVIQDLDGKLYKARWVRGKLKDKSIKPLEEK